MEIHGIKIDLVGLAAVIASITTLWGMFKGKKKREAYRGFENEKKPE